jgi:hypothetical protein
MVKRIPEYDGVRAALAFDEAMAKLHSIGVADAFVAAIEKDPDLQKSLQKMLPRMSAAASPGWSCCVTVSNPLRTGIDEVINPAQPQK